MTARDNPANESDGYHTLVFCLLPASVAYSVNSVKTQINRFKSIFRLHAVSEWKNPEFRSRRFASSSGHAPSLASKQKTTAPSLPLPPSSTRQSSPRYGLCYLLIPMTNIPPSYRVFVLVRGSNNSALIVLRHLGNQLHSFRIGRILHISSDLAFCG